MCPNRHNNFCLKCSSDGIKCEICEYGYFYDEINDECSPCNEYTSPKNYIKCKNCNYGYFKYKNKCSLCSNHCIECFGPNPEHCIRPENGYYYDILTNSLKKCQINCGQCIDQNNCVKCIFPYCLKGSECILSGILGCQKCSDTLICNKCMENYYKIENICIKCKLPCKKCNENGVCVECYKGYNLNQEHICEKDE